MYQHPAALDVNARHYQQEALRDAANRRLVHEATESDGHTPAQHQLVAAAVAVLMIVALVALL